MSRLSRWLYRVSKGWVALAAIVLFFVFTPADPARNRPRGLRRLQAIGPSPDQSFFYSTGDLYRMADAFGAAGRAAYVRARWTFDVVWPLVYTFFLATAISWLGKRAFSGGKPLAPTKPGSRGGAGCSTTPRISARRSSSAAIRHRRLSLISWRPCSRR